MEYLDFDLIINYKESDRYPLAVLRSPAGEARTTFHLPFDELALERYRINCRLRCCVLVVNEDWLLPRKSKPRRISERHSSRRFSLEMCEAAMIVAWTRKGTRQGSENTLASNRRTWQHCPGNTYTIPDRLNTFAYLRILRSFGISKRNNHRLR